ncbi:MULTISPECIES: hypothetical protein [Vibrio]|uniref:Lipoprotein n=1 Tax=Vibrio proteolyticus NBRC 13287 TaxID=1219065 RepID=U3BIN9_VIBPR|nr:MULTISPECIES: hypothetical protein [Vibrio]NAX19664.1 hypothetical protein [Vibrio sp. V39_P1S14PM300]GAD66518.1 hypothetical protein VPR01S_04_01230 [Vibrio proteolyticus NBRC 13287]
MKKAILCATAGLILAGCQSTMGHVPAITADQAVITQAQQALEKYDDFINVDDSGLITFTRTLPMDYVWAPVEIKKISRQVACDDLRFFVDRGMVVKMVFEGQRGRVDYFDQQRCIDEF